ncbi:hypothetical protein NQ318_012504 [Aromia moschata]|uniref:VWFA domain-containing protein n=1 Tax=Aromia moschata TaxID=1265417 RepID=A0AAV8XDB1_9CUCU|nr:hypothetical protein NQ318_012504 [Aromia moschata]
MDVSKKIVCNGLVVLIFITLITYTSCGVDIKDVARNLSEDVKQIKNNELGVPFILKLYNNFMHAPGNADVLEHVKYMAHKLESKINNVFVTLDIAKSMVQHTSTSKDITSLPSLVAPCSLSDSEKFNIRFDIEKIKKHMGMNSTAVKRQYFISDSEVRKTLYSPFSPCNECEETIIWDNYIKRNVYQPKNIVLILDIGGSLGLSQLYLIKNIAKRVISLLNTVDRIALLTIGSNYTYFKSGCDSKESDTSNLKLANISHIRSLNNYIDSIAADSGATNHLLGIQKALEIVSNERALIRDETIMILYISRGLLSSLMEPKSVLATIAEFTDNNNISLVINTCAVIADFRPIMYEPQFLRDMAEQNYTKYGIHYKPNLFRKIGLMLTVNSTKSVPFICFQPNIIVYIRKNVSLPNRDPVSGDLVVSFTKGWTLQGSIYMFGTDVYFSSLVEDLIYYSSNQEYSYAFLMDLEGKMLIHPSFFKPSTVSHDLLYVDIKNFEKISDIEVLRRRLLVEGKGSHKSSKNNGTDLVSYTWNRVGDYYVVCIVVNIKYGPPNRPYRHIRFQSPSENKFLYHNLEDYKLCRHLNLLATIDVNSLYLSTSCFQSPFVASRTTQDKLIIQGYLAYLKDDTRLLANPGLKEEIRDEVSALSHVLDFLRKKHLSSVMSKFVVRRYASSYNGVLQMFPGSVLKPGLQPTKRPWFLKALRHRGKVVFIPPYLDKGGAGYIVTIAYATSQLVVAMDVTYGYMFKLLLNHMSICLDANITCFLIDDQGYIIYHPGLMDVSGARSVVEQQHIVHKESHVSNDILNHKYFIQKLLCNNYIDNTIQRYYRLNTSFTDVLVNFAPVERCVTYRITSVPNTNIFIGVVNASCDFVTTFCPCSIVDRLCLNCNRMEQKECECPCECPLDDGTDTCKSENTKKNMTDNPPCTWYTEDTSLESSFTIDTESELEPCFPISCQAEKSYLSCLGLIGCEWCRYDMDRNYLRKPFCASISTCFNGVFDTTTSYTGDISSDSEYSPMGPILGSIIAMCVLFILLFFCYRSYTNPLTERLYLSSTQDQLRMSDLNVNDNYHDLGNHRDKLPAGR